MTGNVLATRYELIEQLAEGLLFSVYRARDLMRSQVVTLKILRAPYAQNETLRERLAVLAETRKRLQHPNLVSLLSAELEESPPFLVEEFVRALDLATRIRRTAPFTVPIAVEIMIGIVEGLEALHRAGLVHTDLRPANVLVGSEWHVWLNGVGMRSVYQADSGLLTEHEARAVPYTAPEVLQGQAPSPQSDLYACGVIFYEMLTSFPPFQGETPLQIAQAHLNQPVPSSREQNPAVPRAVEGIIFKCLQKDPSQRYPNALSLLNDLKAVRDALRFGKPLGWSPTDLSQGTTDLFSRPRATAPTPAPMEPEEMEEEDEIPRWLRTMIRLTGAIVVIALVIALGAWLALRMVPEDRPVPLVVGKTLQEANQILREMGFEPEVKQEGYSEQYPPGVVYSTDPPAGRVIRKGSRVYLWVSRGSRMVEVPDVRGQPESQARLMLERAGLAVKDEVQEQEHPTIPLGFVIDTLPPHGQKVDRSTPVQLIVSKGFLTSPPNFETPETPPPPEPAQPETSEAPLREFIVKIDLTNQPERRIRIEVSDARGERTLLDEMKAGGQVHEIPIQAYGARVRIRVYADNQLIQEISR
ncbi:MAG: protein kinase [Armatimonadetes bacterium]|nr:protein kinase [Armatimonadota bacterium]